MKKVLSLILLIGWALSLSAQSTTVSATITDTDAFLWKNGTYSFTLVPNPNFPTATYVWDGGTLATPIIGSLNGSGVLSQNVPSSNHITPAGSQWKIGICPNATSGCFSYTISVTGATLNLTSTLSALAIGPRFPVTTTGYGYGTVEVTAVAKPGVIFYDTTDGSCNISNGSTWDSCGGTSGPATALSPNPTLVGQMWGYLHGAAPNQGWTATNILQASLTDFGGACDGVTPDDAAFAEAQAAGVLILIIPPTCAGNSVVSTPLDLSYLYTLIAYVGITYTGTDAGPGIKISGQSVNYPLQVKRGTTTAGQILLEISPGVNFTSQFPGLLVYNADGSTNNNFTSVHFKAASGGAVDVGYLYTDSPITVDTSANLNVNGGTINNLNGLTYNSGDPIQMAGSASTKLSLNNVTLFDGKTANGCFIPLKNDNAFNPAQINLHNVIFNEAGSFSGHGICGPTSATGTDIVNGDFRSTTLTLGTAINGQVQGNLVFGSKNVASAPNVLNGVATNFYYSAAGIAIPTPWFSDPANAFVSDQTTACTGTYTSGGAVKCKVWWNGSAWTAF